MGEWASRSTLVCSPPGSSPGSPPPYYCPSLTHSHTGAPSANKMVGGGVLGGGKAQEEIRFSISPELILTTMLCEEMTETEAICVEGVERYATYEGYSGSFRCTGKCRAPSTSEVSPGATVVAIDALAWPMDRQVKEGLRVCQSNVHPLT